MAFWYSAADYAAKENESNGRAHGLGAGVRAVGNRRW
jgi:hypothetical protein